MPRTRECDYCGDDIEPGTGTLLVMNDGSTIDYCSSKCEKNADLGREPRDVEWTADARGAKGPAVEEETADESEADDATDAEDEEADEEDVDESEAAPDLEAAEEDAEADEDEDAADEGEDEEEREEEEAEA